MKRSNPNPIIGINVVDLTDTSLSECPRNDDRNDVQIIEEHNTIIPYLTNQLNQARSFQDFYNIRRICFELGDAHVQLKNYEDANKLYREALQLAIHFNDDISNAKACYKLAKMFEETLDFELSLSFFFEFLNKSKELGDRKNVREAYKKISDLYANTGNKEFYLRYCQQYYVLCRELNLNFSAAEILEHINFIRFDLKLPKFTNHLIPDIRRDISQPEHYNSRLIDRGTETVVIDQSRNQISLSWDDEHRKGIILYQLKKFDKAIGVFVGNLDKIEEISDSLEKTYCKAESAEKIGACWRELGHYDIAIKFSEDLMITAQTISDYVHEFTALCQLEICYKRKSENLQVSAICEKNELLKIAENYKLQRLRMMKENTQFYSMPRYKLAEIFYFSGNTDEAIETYKTILKEAESKNYEMDQFLAKLNIGHAYFVSGINNHAFKFYREAKILTIKLGNQASQAPILYNTYQIFRFGNNDLISAKTELNSFILVLSQIGDNFGKCLGYESMCDLLKEMKDYKESYEFAKKYLECASIIGDESEIKLANRNVEELNSYMRDMSEAGPSNQSNEISTSGEIQQSYDILVSLWQARNENANEYYRNGDYYLAEKLHLVNLAMFDNGVYNNENSKVVTLKNLGIVEQAMEKFESAYHYLCRAIHDGRVIDNISLMQSIQYELGCTLLKKSHKMYELNSDFENSEARSGLIEAADIFKEYLENEENPKNKLLAISYLGKIYSLLGELDEAIRYYQKNIQNAIDLGNEFEEMKMNKKLGRLYMKKLNFGDAIKHYRRCGYLANKLGKLTVKMKVYYLLGDIYERNDDFENATECYSLFAVLANTNPNQNYEDRFKAYRRLCEISLKAFQYSNALQFACIHREIAHESKNQDEITDAENNIKALLYVNNILQSDSEQEKEGNE